MGSFVRSRASGRITLNEVALAAGVSPITASRALRGERRVASELVAQVRAAAERLGYVPDPAARALASSRSSNVAVLIPLLTNTLFVDLLESVHNTLAQAGFQTLIGVTHYDPGQEESLLRSYMAHRPAGLLVSGFDRTPGSRQLIAQSGIPCVHLMEIGQDPDVYAVGLDQQAAGRTMTEHLIARGRRRIAFVAAQMDTRMLQRLAGYREALQAAGLYDDKLENLHGERSSIALGRYLFEETLGRHPDVDAMFFCNDDLAQGGLLAALRLGVAVPGRVAVGGFNDLAGSAQMLPPLTTIRTARGEIGTRAATMLLRLMRGESVDQPCENLGYELVVRGST
ncbi:LacI family transcriptional regulator [Rhodoferax koreense]|uniref:LacI family transcriptional regulator n=1 Tax=Rhodoferax koreensis TaxID=1842727 RepID=A0A1P8JUR8_9BURK|nr:LacI family DNA-binding transcriptional regulator [Rhodoferax koreense]APW37431.1 LacI family transcriptional regulator [Rhodoferax koreense]